MKGQETCEKYDSLNVALDYKLEIEPLFKKATNFSEYLEAYGAMKEKIKTAKTAGQRKLWQDFYDREFKAINQIS